MVVEFDDFDWQSLPKCLIGEAPSSAHIVPPLQAFVSGGWAITGRSMTKIADTKRHTAHGLMVFLNTKIYYGKIAFRRSQNIFGRILNQITGIHPYYVKLSGAHLAQCVAFLDELEAAKDMPATATCAIRIDYAERILEKLKSDPSLPHDS